MQHRSKARRGPAPAGWRVGVLLGGLLVVSGCATPVGVTRVSTQAMYKGLTASVLSTGRPSQYSEHLLIPLGLSARFDEEPEAVLARGPGIGLSREYLFVLAELSPGARDADPLDPRLRLAANLYNVGLAQGLGGPDGESVEIESVRARSPSGIWRSPSSRGACSGAATRCGGGHEETGATGAGRDHAAMIRPTSSTGVTTKEEQR